MSIPRSRDLRVLAGAAGLSALGDFMAIFPLILHVQGRTGSAFAVSALIVALWGPVVLAAGTVGAILDRFENRRILITVSLGQAIVVAAMLLCVDTLWALLPLMMLLGLGVASAAVRPCMAIRRREHLGDVARNLAPEELCIVKSTQNIL